MRKTDMQLKVDIENELRSDPNVHASQIDVTVEQGAVSLWGSVGNYPEKWAAEAATRRVRGVRGLAHGLIVEIPSDHERSDREIAGAIRNALQWNVYVPKTVTARVQNGDVTLEGRCTWSFQRDAAERAVRYLVGIGSVRDTISLTPHVAACFPRLVG